jgi:hypothetical protein
MPNETVSERRRMPRVELGAGRECRLDLRTRVRLLDISVSGVLLSGEIRLPVGTRAHMQTSLAAVPFGGEITVRRIAGESAVGATFMALDERSRQRLEAFLRRANV